MPAIPASEIRRISREVLVAMGEVEVMFGGGDLDLPKALVIRDSERLGMDFDLRAARDGLRSMILDLSRATSAVSGQRRASRLSIAVNPPAGEFVVAHRPIT